MNSEQKADSTNSTKPVKPNLEAIINEVSASEDFQNLLKSVSKNIGSIVEQSRKKNFSSESDKKPEVIPLMSQEANQTSDPKNHPPNSPPNPPPSASKEIRTVPLEPSTSIDEDDDNIQDTIMTLLSDGEGNTLGEIASSIEHHLGKISSSLEKLVNNATTVQNTQTPHCSNELSVDLD